jgi:hypothetical protein
MTVAAIGSNPQQTLAAALDPSQPSGALQQLATNYNSLGQALDAGNLSGAQQAFTALISGVSSGGGTTASATSASSGASSGAGSSVGADLVSLGQALQAGNLPAAQQAFSSLQQTVASVGGAKGGSGAGASSAGASSASASSASSSTTITNQASYPNSDGTVTVVITYADGSTQTSTQAGSGGGSGGSGPTNLLA